jgi:hypothetical protein
MESSPQGRCGEFASDPAIILVTVAQLIFLTSSYNRFSVLPGWRHGVRSRSLGHTCYLYQGGDWDIYQRGICEKYQGRN